MKATSLTLKLLCLSLIALLGVASCGESTDQDYQDYSLPTTEVTGNTSDDHSSDLRFREVSSSEYFPDHGASVAALEERVYWSDVVVRARFVSAGDDILRFRAISYQKGTGPAKFTVQAETEGRDTQWDNQDAILFLKIEASDAADFTFTDTTSWEFRSVFPPGWENLPTSPEPDRYTGSLPEGYTLGTNNPVWVPVTTQGAGASQGGQRSANDGPSEILVEYDSSGAGKTVSENTLQDTISWVSGPTPPQSGARSAFDSSRPSQPQTGQDFEWVTLGTSTAVWWNNRDYETCVIRALMTIRSERDAAVYGSGEKSPIVIHIQSGVQEATILEHTFGPSGAGSGIRYSKYGVSGPDADLFAIKVLDDDTNPLTGYTYKLVTSRPLPNGAYKVHRMGLPWFREACNFRPYTPFILDVIAEAPPGTVHEAFFDPATTTAGVGYSAGPATTTGVLSPAEFSVGGRAITITGLTWHNGQVVLTVDRVVQIPDGLIFIEPDGSAGLRLSEADSTKDWAARTFTWEVSEQPWESGDELMLRMGPIPLPAVRNLTAERDSAGQVVLSWEVAYTAGVNGYKIWRYLPGRDEGPMIYVSDTLSTDTTYTDLSAPTSNLTEYRVQAIDRIYTAGESSESVRVGSQ